MRSLYKFGSFALDPRRRVLRRGASPVPLTPKAFDLLVYLVNNPNRAIAKEELLQAVWGDSFVEEGNLTQNIFLLRKALANGPETSGVIATLPRKGYQFTAEVTTVTESDHAADAGEVRPMEKRQALPADVQVTPATVAAEAEEKQVALLTSEPPKPYVSGARVWKTALLASTAAIVAVALAGWEFLVPQAMPRVARSLQLTHSGVAEPFGPVLSDGLRLYFTNRVGGSHALVQISEQEGGEPALIPTSIAGLAVFDIDRRQSRLLVGVQDQSEDRRDPLWTVPAGGGSAQRLGGIRAGSAVWWPEGHGVLYSEDGELFSAAADGTQIHKLFSAHGSIQYLRRSPDGRRVGFTVREQATGFVTLWEMLSDGSDPHPIHLGQNISLRKWGDGECCGDWSPDGTYFVFRSTQGGIGSLFAVRQRGSWFRKRGNTVAQLYSSPDRIGEPRFSADGKKVVFVNYQERRQLVRYDFDRKLFVPYLGGIPARHVSFSRDGKWLAYKNEADDSLWRSRIDGTDARRLTFPPIEALHSTWSPDGKKIAFQGSGNLYQVSSDGGTPELLTAQSESAGQPSWSPDGKSIAFARWTVLPTGGWRPAIYILDLASRQYRLVPGSENSECPQWSPDGKYIAASSRNDQNLAIFDLAAQQWFAVADGLPYGWGLRWSTDSRYVYYQHMYEGEEQPIFRVRISDHKVERITTSRQILRADVLSYTMTGLTPDNSPLASVVGRNSDICALELELP